MFIERHPLKVAAASDQGEDPKCDARMGWSNGMWCENAIRKLAESNWMLVAQNRDEWRKLAYTNMVENGEEEGRENTIHGFLRRTSRS